MSLLLTDHERSAAWRSALMLFDDDLRRRGSGRETRDVHAADLRHFARWAIAQRSDPTAVTPQQLRRYCGALAATNAATAIVERRLATLRAFFAMLGERGESDLDPAASPCAAGLDRAPALGLPPPALEPEQISRLLDCVPASTPLELRDRALFEIAYSCGLRVEELVRLDVDSVQAQEGLLRVVTGSRTRLVPARKPTMRAVARYLGRARAALSRGPGEPALFLSKSGRRLSASDVRRRLGVWSRHAASQGAAQPDALRLSVATHLLEGGTDARRIRELLDHASLFPKQTYSRVESARLKVAYARAHPRA